MTKAVADLPFVSEVQVTGNYPTLMRKQLGLFSLDFALQGRGELGLPLRTIVEIAGREGVGKSTLSYYIAGRIAEKGTISLCDVELLDIYYIESATGISGFKGIVHMIDMTEGGKMRHHEKMLWEMVRELSEENTTSCVIDSISALQPVVEQDVINDAKGEFGQAFMGKRAKMVGQVVRAISGVLSRKANPSVALLVNHVYPNLGTMGESTAGGVVKDAAKAVSLKLWVQEPFYEDDTHRPLGFLVGGEVRKNRFGGKGGRFQFYTVPGLGVHPGVSAMFDCIELGIASKDKQGRVKMDSKNFGYIRADLMTYAAEGKTRKFLPFLDAIQKHREELEDSE